MTLGRALVETGDLRAATEALSRVHAAAPDNLAAIKGLADIRHRRGERQEALALYGRALALAPHDPELEHLVGVVTDEIAERAPAAAGPRRPPSTPPPDWRQPPSRPRRPCLIRPSPAAPESPEQIAALERWLNAILADRASRT